MTFWIFHKLNFKGKYTYYLRIDQKANTFPPAHNLISPHTLYVKRDHDIRQENHLPVFLPHFLLAMSADQKE